MIKGKRKGIVLFVLLCFLASIVAGCSSSKDASAPKGDDYVVQLGYRDCDHMTAAVISKDSGIFEKLGLKVQVTGSGEVSQAMAAGKMDVAYISATSSFLAYKKDPRVKMVANNHLGGAWYLVGSNNIKTAKDLVGKKVALGAKAHETNAGWINAATKLGLPLDADKNYQNFDMKDANKFIALKTGQLDGYTTCDPYGSYAEYEKIGHILAADAKLPDGTWGDCCGLMMRMDFVKEHPELAKKMVIAHTQAIELMYTNPLKAGRIFAANYKVPEEVGYLTMYKKTVKEGRTMTWKLEPDALDRTLKSFMNLGVKKWQGYKWDPTFIDSTIIDSAGVDDFDDFIKTKVDPVFPLGMSYEDWKKKATEIDNANKS